MSFDADNPHYIEPKKSNKTCLVIGLILGVGGGSLLLCCGGGGWFAVRLFLDSLAGYAKTELAQQPVVIEHLGEVQTVTTDAWRSMADPGMDNYVFHVTGSKGTGEVVAECDTDEPETGLILSGTLILPTGERFELIPFNFDELEEMSDDVSEEILDESMDIDPQQPPNAENAEEVAPAPGSSPPAVEAVPSPNDNPPDGDAPAEP